MSILLYSSLAALFFGTSTLSDSPGPRNASLRVKVENITAAKGRIHIGLYKDPATFPKKKLASGGKEVSVTATGAMDIELTGLAPGRYAIAVFHDLNGNGKLDANVFGVPTEPYAFSNGAVAKWSSPGFEEAAFDLPEGGKAISVKLAFWKEQ
ncbi:MAG: DUF2141 domain-containing protein [Saprospiraceae bacterium]|nr:DUF2141 domain-containing protein [Saprospiraceae bacterium]